MFLFTLRLPKSRRDKLHELALKEERSVTWILNKMIEYYTTTFSTEETKRGDKQ